MNTKSFTDLPDTTFCNIIEYLGWVDVGRFDNTLLNRNARNSYLDALKIRKVKVEGYEFWKPVDKGLLNWLISRNIQVISWHFTVDNKQLMTIANGLRRLQSLIILPDYPSRKYLDSDENSEVPCSHERFKHPADYELLLYSLRIPYRVDIRMQRNTLVHTGKQQQLWQRV